MARALHHLDLWVDDVTTADGTYLFMEHSADQHGEHDRLRPGVNHLAMTVGSRDELDRMRAESTEHGWHEMYADRYPHAGGEQHVALYVESSEGFEVEVVVEADVGS